MREEKEIFSVSGRPTKRPQCTMSEFRIGEVLKEAKPRRKKEKKMPSVKRRKKLPISKKRRLN